MPTFIDESGDIGWKDSSEKYFRLGAVWVPSESVEPLRSEIQLLRNEMNLPSNYEFKFAETHKHPERRERFFQKAKSVDFQFAVCSHEKPLFPHGSLNKTGFYWSSSVVLAAYLRPVYELAETQLAAKGGKLRLLRELVIVDDNGDKTFLKMIKESFRALRSTKKTGVSLVGKVKFRDSRPDEMIQLVDMVLGAVGAHLDGKETRWYEMIAEKRLEVVSLP